jgi:hypothetical protein
MFSVGECAELYGVTFEKIHWILFLTFMGPCIVIIIYYINPNKMHTLQSLFYLTIALHVSGVTITHLQDHKTTVTTVSGNRYTIFLPAAIVEELELI